MGQTVDMLPEAVNSEAVNSEAVHSKLMCTPITNASYATRPGVPNSACRRSGSTRSGLTGVRRSTPTWIVLLTLIVPVLAKPAQAGRELDGQIFVGESMRLKIQLREGFFKELLRKLRLRNSPRMRLDLTTLGQDLDRVFIGTDFNLYVQKKTADDQYTMDQTFKIGRATRLYDIKLNDDVTLEEFEDGQDRFKDGGIRKGLKVGLGKKIPIDQEDAQKAGMEFFLNELVFEYDKPSSHPDEIDNYHIIRDTLYKALPEGIEGETPEQFQNFKIFIDFIQNCSDGNLLVFREFLTEKVTRVEGRITDPEDKLRKEYERLKADVFERTAGF